MRRCVKVWKGRRKGPFEEEMEETMVKRRKMIPEKRSVFKPQEDAKFSPSVAATAGGFFPAGDSNECHVDKVSGMGRAKKDESSEPSDVDVGFFGKLYSWLKEQVDEEIGMRCKAKPTGRLFPLPSSSDVLSQLFPKTPNLVLGALRCLVWSLNSLNGEGVEGPQSASGYQNVVLGGLLDDCERVCAWKVPDDPPSWKQFLKVKGVDYKGDEVLTAQSMRWENVESALPKEVGSVNLEDVVEKGCLYYVRHFEEYLLDPADQQCVRPSRVMVPPDNWEVFCANLSNLGVFSRIHEDEVFKVQGKPSLNGLFGVSKNEYSGPWEVMRIRMNLVPLNGVIRGIDGDVGTLPTWAGMPPLHLQPHEDLIVSSGDLHLSGARKLAPLPCLQSPSPGKSQGRKAWQLVSL